MFDERECWEEDVTFETRMRRCATKENDNTGRKIPKTLLGWNDVGMFF